MFCITEDAGEPVEHAGRAAKHFGPGLGVGTVEPGGQPDAARNAVEFRDFQAVLGQQDVRPDHPGQVGAKRLVPLEVNDRLRLAPVQPLDRPCRQSPLGAPPVNHVRCLIKLEQHTPEFLELLDGLFVERERTRGHAPFVTGKQAIGRQALLHMPGDLPWIGLFIVPHQDAAT